MDSENVCRFFKFGFCKFKLQCRNKHVTEVCDDQKCNQKSCQKRHPRMCKYYANFGNCKLGTTCAYAHKIQTNVEIGRFEQKLEELTKIINGKDDVIRNLASKIEDLVKENKKKDAVIEKLVKDVKELSSKKDRKVAASSKKVTRASKKKENMEKVNVTKEDSQSDVLIENEQSEEEEETLVCPVDKNNELFMECYLKLIGEIEVSAHKEQSKEEMKTAYLNFLSEIEKEMQRLDIFKFDFKFLVIQMRSMMKKSEFQKNPAKAILDHIKSVREDLKKVANGERLL